MFSVQGSKLKLKSLVTNLSLFLKLKTHKTQAGLFEILHIETSTALCQRGGFRLQTPGADSIILVQLRDSL